MLLTNTARMVKDKILCNKEDSVNQLVLAGSKINQEVYKQFEHWAQDKRALQRRIQAPMEDVHLRLK